MNGIEYLYEKLGAIVTLPESFSRIKNLTKIIKSCRLKPYDYMFFNKKDISLYRDWYDEYGNSFKLVDKKIEIIYNDLSVEYKKKPTTDLYGGLSLDKIYKISKYCHIIYGKDEDYEEDCYYVTFVGLDNYYRTYLYMFGEWKKVSPLLIGFNNLKYIAKNSNINFYLKSKGKQLIPFKTYKVIMTKLPVDIGIVDFLEEHEIINNIINI